MKSRSPRSLALLTVFAALSGCGGNSAKSTSATLADGTPANLGCANPVAVDSVPAEWRAVEGSEMISGEAGRWKLTKVVLHSAIPAPDGSLASASTTSLFGADDALYEPIQSVDCKDLRGMGTFSVSIQPWETIANADGAVDTRRNIRFRITDRAAEKVAEIERVNTTAKFGVETLDSRRQEADAKAVGVVYQSKTYRISPTEMEIRLHAEVPDQNGNGGKLYFNSAMHYELRNP